MWQKWRDCGRHSARSTQGPDFASALEVLLVDLHVVGARGFGDGEKLGDVLGAAVAEPYGPRIVGQVELDLEIAPVPAGLRGVVVGVDHGVDAVYANRDIEGKA